MNRFNFFVFILLTFVAFSCNRKNDPSENDLGYTYFPVQEGDYFIYEVIDTTFEGVNTYTIQHYFVKEEIHETVVVNDEERYQIYLYYRAPNETWKDYPDSNWTVFQQNDKIIRIEDNVRLVKLVFPFEVNKQWDGNISDTESDPQKYYTMKELYRPFSYYSLDSATTYHYDKTVSIVHFDNNSAIDDNYSVEVYANTIGMVYKEIQVYKYDQSDLFAKNIELGQHLKKVLVEYGRYK